MWLKGNVEMMFGCLGMKQWKFETAFLFVLALVVSTSKNTYICITFIDRDSVKLSLVP